MAAENIDARPTEWISAKPFWLEHIEHHRLPQGVAMETLVRTGVTKILTVGIVMIMEDGGFVLQRQGECSAPFESLTALYLELERLRELGML